MKTGVGIIIASLAIGVGVVGCHDEAAEARQRQAEHERAVTEAAAQLRAQQEQQASDAKRNEVVAAALATAARERAAEQLRVEEAARVAQAREQLVKSPSTYLEASDVRYFDKGIVNDYRQITQMRVLNKSKFPVTDVQGEVDWTDDAGRKTGSVPFSIRGSIPAGDTKQFAAQDGSLTNGALQTSVTHAAVRFTHVTIVEAP
jgi:hypothetical protein